MEDGLVHCYMCDLGFREQKVLILIVVEDGLVLASYLYVSARLDTVLILIVVEDGLVQILTSDKLFDAA